MTTVSRSASRWLLPAGVSDLLPVQAEALEALRRRLLDAYRGAGYRLVQPPLIEYLESLLIGSGRDLDLSTFKLVDQVSGRTLGVRADTTPQVARIDAHLLQQSGPVRLCYCGSVLHATPAVLGASREPVQAGAELYGHAGPEADIEIVDLLLRSLALCGAPRVRLDLSEHGLVRLLLQALDGVDEQEVFSLLESRDLPGLRAWARQWHDAPQARALLELPRCAGPVADVLARAATVFAAFPQARPLLQRLDSIARSARLADHDGFVEIGLDLSDTRGFRYHTGLSFAAYVEGTPQAVARGGRYDGVGQAFGRARPATGFSLDLRELVELSDHPDELRPIHAPWSEDPALWALIQSLRAQGHTVVQALPGQADEAHPAQSSERSIEQRGGQWQLTRRTP